jgi:TolA-binding protein
MMRQLIKIKNWRSWILAFCLIFTNGCVGVSQFPFGAKPPVAAGQQAGISRHAPEKIPPLEDKSKLAGALTLPAEKVMAPSNDVGVSEDKTAVVEDVAAPPATLEDMPGRDEEKNGVDMAFIVNRAALYRQKMMDWNQLAGGLVTLDMGGTWPEGWYGCVQKLEMVFAGYRRLQKGESAAYDRGLTAYQRDVEYLESGCDEIMAVGQGKVSKRLAGFRGVLAEQAESLVRQYVDQGRNQEASQAYEYFIKSYGEGTASNELKFLYGKALMRQGRLEAALALFADIWDKDASEKAPLDMNDLGVVYADLLLANGRTAAARKIYEEIGKKLGASDDSELWVNNQLRILDKGAGGRLLAAYTEVLRAYYRFNGRNLPDEFSANLAQINNSEMIAMSDNSEIIAKKVEDEVNKRTDEQLAKIDELVEGQEFEQARTLLADLSTTVSEERHSEVLAAQDRLDEAEVAARQSRQQLDKQEVDRQWQKAVDLLDRREYKAAIGSFRQLLTSEYADEAHSKMMEAANMAAVETRRKAASLFFKARKTRDQKLKRQLMLQSRDLLQQVVEEFPNVEIIDKIKRNLQVLNEQLNSSLPASEK